jgi:hypothetical protein
MWPFKKKEYAQGPDERNRTKANILFCAECGRPTLCEIHNRWVQATIRIDDLEAKHAKLYSEWMRDKTLRGGPVSEPLHEKTVGGDKGAESVKPKASSNATYKDTIRVRNDATILE